MAYGTLRTAVVTAIQFRLNDVRAGTSTARWTDGQVDTAIGEAVKLAEPLGYETWLDQVYPARTLTFASGTEASLGTLRVLDILRVESFVGGKRTLVPPTMWSFERTDSAFLTLAFTPATGETIRAHVRLALDPDASVIVIDQTLVEEYAMSVLFERYVVFGSESSTITDSQRAQAHRIAGDQRKIVLMQQQYPLIQAPAMGTAARPAAQGS